jgi:hypothetical protein
MPHVVLVEDVILKADGLIVELGAIEAAGETRVLQNLLLFVASRSSDRRTCR